MSPKIKTRTPAMEAGGGSRRSSLSGDDGDELVMRTGPPIDPLEGGAVAGGPHEEQETLLGRGIAPLKLDETVGPRGRVEILGYAFPKPFLYLISLPPLIILLNIILSYLFPVRPFLLRPLLSNGTHSFHPTTLLISLDGFRPSYLDSHPHLLSSILALATSTHGLRAESMQPVFPSLTFPNHWALMTGLYPESHGIIANDFWDPQAFGEGKGGHFKYTDSEKSWHSEWWWGEPIWSVVEKVGRKSAVSMWPGPPVTMAGRSPSYFVPYRNLDPTAKLNQIFEWLDLSLTDRPEFIASYFPDIDQAGHQGGPDSAEVNKSLGVIDEIIGGLVTGLAQRNLTELVDAIIVSDHGMASTSNERIIYLDDILGQDGFDAIEHKDGWPSVGLRFKHGADVDLYLIKLLEAADKSNGTFAVYTHETMPERWHFSHGHRIAPIYIVPHLGWAISDHHEHEVIHEGDYRPKGNHGYDNIFPEMQAVFFAHGPFAKALKTASKGFVSVDPPILEGFRNLEIFSLVMRLQGLTKVEPPHNGTLGFWDTYLS
ncbi:hypothetical protein IAR55_000727 [Kwoniella newhampshirensis]|uniref:Type I phosphodiesterase/nucleotide pyrophosphatase n=1 Tax=Kwoniella newhampshirensis TaxID=1651941 RepID=A0AAW0Z3W9_9TREE